ncbi:MAG: ABC transporter ATP-binding protein, partial [Paraprevotella sp.]|nr:ABC transporter ATP-binding protein [Paraprevotella sp.]
QLRNVSKTYTNGGKVYPVLHHIDLSVEQGDFVCIIGGSGCGKSTLLNILAGFERPDEGKVRIQGELVTRPSRKHQMIFQQYGRLSWRTVAANVAFALEGRGLSRTQRREKIDQYLALVGLENSADAYPHQLSGGMRQRVAVARALAAEPDLLFMDEPFGALDAITKMKLQDELKNICASSGRTILMVTHDIEEAVYLGDRILVMKPNPGRIFQDIPVTLSTPRQRTEVDFIALRTKLLEALDLAVRIEPDYQI